MANNSKLDFTEIILDFFITLYRTIRLNWLYLIMAFAAPLLLYYVGQGMEIVRYLDDQASYPGWWKWLNMPLVLTSFIFLFYSIWAIPVWSLSIAITIMRWFGKPTTINSVDLFTKLADYYNGAHSDAKVYPIRTLANLPLFIFLILILALRQNSFFKDPIIVGLLIMASILFALFIKKKIKENKSNIESSNLGKILISNHLAGYFTHLFCIVLVTLCWRYEYYAAGIVFIFLLYLANDLYYYFIENFVKISSDSFKTSNTVYSVFVVTSIVILIGLFVLQSADLIHKISPIFIMNVCFTFFIGLIDLLIKTPKDIFTIFEMDRQEMEDATSNELISETKGPVSSELSNIRNASTSKFLKLFKAVNFVIVLLALNTLFIKSINQHKIYKLRIPGELTKRDSLSNYFSSWMSSNNFDILQDTVYLVVASGGGSRAGFWTGYHLDELQNELPCFKRRLFALSTVSGSTSGANMALSKWYLDQKYKIVPSSESTNIQNFWTRLYNYNYLSAALFGLLIGDGITGWFTFHKDFDTDRNYFHEQDEINALKNNYNTEEHNRIESIVSDDYMYRWRDQDKYKYPLHLINSATTQSGKRVVALPYAYDPLIHPTVIDIYGIINNQRPNENCHYSLPMSTCVKISESFPIVSSYYYMDSVGSLIDGGLFENTGSNTMFELYSYLHSKFPEVKFKVIFMLNGRTDNPSTNSANNVILNTLSSVASSPFSGHSWYWENYFKQTLVSDRDSSSFVGIELKNKQDQWMSFPLGILLSKYTLDSLYKYTYSSNIINSDCKTEQKQPLINPIN